MGTMIKCDFEGCNKENMTSQLGLYNHKRRVHKLIDPVLKEIISKEFREKFLEKTSVKRKPPEVPQPAINSVAIIPKNKPKIVFEVPFCQIEGYEIGKTITLFNNPIYRKKFRKLPTLGFYVEADNKEMIPFKEDLEIPIPNHKNIIWRRKYHTKLGLYAEQ